MDWIALGLLALTIAWAAGAYASLAASINGSIPFSRAVDLANTVWLPGLVGLIVGIAALADSKGRRKWPGVLALFSPLIAVVVWIVGWIVAFGEAWGGLP